MPSITLKNIPEKLHRKLKSRAKKHGRSLTKEAIVCLETAVNDERMSPEEEVVNARALRERSPLRLTDSDIRRGIEWGRK